MGPEGIEMRSMELSNRALKLRKVEWGDERS